MKSRQLDQRRYRFEEVTGRKPTWQERSLLQRYTVSEVIALIKAKDEMLKGHYPDLTKFFGGV